VYVYYNRDLLTCIEPVVLKRLFHYTQMLNSSNKYSATASILAEFLPILDRLTLLRDKYDQDDFGKQYSALPGAMKTAFTALGVAEYTVNTGDAIDKSRMAVIEEEHSEEYPKNKVIRPIALGVELQGNVIRMAEVVGSLGPENTQEETTTPPPPEEDIEAQGEAGEETEQDSSFNDT